LAGGLTKGSYLYLSPIPPSKAQGKKHCLVKLGSNADPGKLKSNQKALFSFGYPPAIFPSFNGVLINLCFLLKKKKIKSAIDGTPPQL
jgi:hypothetical protein